MRYQTHFLLMVVVMVFVMGSLIFLLYHALYIDNPEIEGVVVDKYVRDNGNYRLIICDTKGDYYRCAVNANQYFNHNIGDDFKGSVYWAEKT